MYDYLPPILRSPDARAVTDNTPPTVQMLDDNLLTMLDTTTSCQVDKLHASSEDLPTLPTLPSIIFWTDHAPQSTGCSPFYMAHSIEPILSFNLTLTTFLMPNLSQPIFTADLTAICGCS